MAKGNRNRQENQNNMVRKNAAGTLGIDATAYFFKCILLWILQNFFIDPNNTIDWYTYVSVMHSYCGQFFLLNYQVWMKVSLETSEGGYLFLETHVYKASNWPSQPVNLTLKKISSGNGRRRLQHRKPKIISEQEDAAHEEWTQKSISVYEAPRRSKDAHHERVE